MEKTLQTVLAEFQQTLLDLGDRVEASAETQTSEYQRGFLRGVAHGYRKASEELDHWVYRGKVPGVGRG